MSSTYDIRDPWASLAGTSAVVTGAAGGIGRAVTDLLSLCDITVIAADRDQAALESAFGGADSPVVPIASDVSTAEGVAAVEEAALATGGPLSLWLNNAGIVSRLPATEITSEDFDSMLRVNTRSTFLGCQAAYRCMAPRGGGSIVNIASMSITRVQPLRAVYAASKAAVAGLTRNLAHEWGHSGVRVNSIAPGFVLTPMSNWHILDDAGRQDLLARIPLGRLADPSDIANTVLMLASPLTAYVSGETIHVDGGWTL
jgi:3-oxoacyl-[acyl-carrier protein] reductase